MARADQIFGPNTIYIDVKRRVSGNDIITIPDGYVIDMTTPDEPKLFIVENEITRHDPYKHIGIQMLRFTISFDGGERDVRSLLMEEISKDSKMLARLEESCGLSTCPNVDNYLDKAVYGPFRGLVIIDEAVPELHSVLERINADISVIELQRYASEDGSEIYHFDTLYGDEDDAAPEKATEKSTIKLSKEERASRRRRRASCDTIVVPAREEGFVRVFLGENQWHAIRIGPAMKERIEYIAGYQVAPVSAVTHIARVREIKPYRDTGKYVVIFDGPAEEIGPISVEDTRYSPQGSVYVRRTDLEGASCLDDAIKAV